MSGKRNVSANSEQRFPLLFDGWPLAYHPCGPAALHLLELIESLPVYADAWVALPAGFHEEAVQKLLHPRQIIRANPRSADKPLLYSGEPGQVVSVFSLTALDSPTGRLRWEQWTLPRAARQIHARLLHTTSLRAPLSSSVPVVVSPVEIPSQTLAAGTFDRWGEALGHGGLSTASAVLWPQDLPESALGAPAAAQQMPPVVHSAFRTWQPRPDDLPDMYLLVPGNLDGKALELLAEVWIWLFSALGETCGLVTPDLESASVKRLGRLCRDAGASEPVVPVCTSTPSARAALFQWAGAVLLPEPLRPWGDALLQALACARPIVAQETPLIDARTGPAGYLVPEHDVRAMSAALLTILMEESFHEQISQAARERSVGWRSEEFPARLAALYRQVMR